MIKNKILLVLIFQGFFGFSQNSSNDSIKLKEVIVSITKIKENIKNSPFAISSKSFSKFQTSAKQFYLSEYIESVPGVFISNDNNFAQDSRISIRGFGSRANFGIRGIKLIVDGVPETTPDGQSQIDNLNLEIIEKIEIIRGTSSSLYGNSSAGVIKIQSISEFDKNFTKIGYALGSNNQEKKQALVGIKSNETFYTFLVSETKGDGYRNFGDFKNSNINFRVKKNISKDSWLNFNFNIVHSPYSNDPGGLTIEEVKQDREQARERNLQYKTSEEINHYKASSSFNKKLNEKLSFSTYAFISNRNFNGKIPVKNGGAIDLKRKYWGIGGSFLFKSKLKTQIGFDVGNQNDRRKRYNNDIGITGNQVLDQNEKFSNLGIYLVNNYNLNRLSISSGIRYDTNKVKLEDLFFSDGDSSGNIILNSLNPSLGINYKLNKKSRIFINTSSGFETPTLNEFSSSPIGTGFNKNLKSQINMGFELGFSLYDTQKKSNIDLVYFKSITNDEILSYEDEKFPNQKFYNNAGKTERNGIEIAGFYTLNRTVISSSYSLGDYVFKEFFENKFNYKGNKIPGIPNDIFTLSIEHKTINELSLNLNFKNIGALYANNSNTIKVDEFNTFNFKIGKEIKLSRSIIYPYLIISNVFDNEYFDNIRINAFGGRYYEPAPKRTIFGGIRIIL
ncbi:TonB-dependent receptor [Flavobacteriaceae bacterium]|nr:TonB-dependent receptor [Flavobacteriaceae bacterium]MDB4164285.1 TonB-dependent receptor [Flavobacteriaceae bacterium]|tara:strand:+ start:1295 stop:3319 length:2025 start_codon:yes stop_codon:yes gene_type:complete